MELNLLGLHLYLLLVVNPFALDLYPGGVRDEPSLLLLLLLMPML